MPRENLWEKSLDAWLKFKDEISKVSQLGRAGVSRSFLIHERMKLMSRLGEFAYRWVNEHGAKDPSQERIVDQINKLNQRIASIDEKVTGITNHLSQQIDAAEGNDSKSERKKISLRKKK